MRLASATIGAISMLASSAHAEPVAWKPEWPTFRPAEVAFTLGSAAQAGFVTFFANDPTANLKGGILFDDAVRDAIRARSRSARVATATVSDWLYYSLMAYPLIDAPLVGGLRGGGKVAVQTLAINLEGFAIAGAYALTFEKMGRVRPLAAECERDPGYDPRCNEHVRMNESNLSGHTSLSFAGAGLTCAHHLHLPLYGGGAADIATCATVLVAAGTQGVLRVVSDNHYATDVMLGAALGFTSGYVVPWLLHYRTRRPSAVSRWLVPTFTSRELGIAGAVAPSVGPSMVGVTLSGSLDAY